MSFMKLFDDGEQALIVEDFEPVIKAEYRFASADDKQKYAEQLQSEIEELQQRLSEITTFIPTAGLSGNLHIAANVWNSNIGYTEAKGQIDKKTALLECLNGVEV